MGVAVGNMIEPFVNKEFRMFKDSKSRGLLCYGELVTYYLLVTKCLPTTKYKQNLTKKF